MSSKRNSTAFINQDSLQASFYSMQDNLKEIILINLFRKMRRGCNKRLLNDPKTYHRSYSLPEVLEHDKHPEEVHAYAAKIAPNPVDKDELTLAQVQKPELQFEWPLWLEAIRT